MNPLDSASRVSLTASEGTAPSDETVGTCSSMLLISGVPCWDILSIYGNDCAQCAFFYVKLTN